MDRASRDNHGLRMHRHLVRFLPFFHRRFDTDGLSILNKHLISTAMDNDLRPMIEGILQIRVHRRLLGSIATAEAAGTTTLLTANGIARDHIHLVAKSHTAIVEQLVLPIMLAVLRVDIDALLDSREALLQLWTGEAALQSRALFPLFQYV